MLRLARHLPRIFLVFWLLALAAPAAAQGAEDADALNARVIQLYQAGKYAEAIPLAERALAIREKALGSDDPNVASSLNNLAELYRSQGRYGEAEPLFKRTIPIYETALGPEHPHVGTALNNLAVLYRAQGRYVEAEPLYKRTLAIRETALGPEHPDVAAALNNLAVLYWAQGRYAEAEPLYKRALVIRERALGPEHPDVAEALNNLAAVYGSQARYTEAEPLYKRALVIRERALGAGHPSVGTVINNLASLYESQGRYAEAEPLYKRALVIRERVLGPEHPDVAEALNNLAVLYERQGRYAEAEPLHMRSLAIRKKGLGPDHPAIGVSHNSLAWLYLRQNDWSRAAEHWRASTTQIKRRAARGLGGTLEGSSKGEAQRFSWYFEGLVKTTQRLAAEGRGNAETLAMEMFETAQWAQSSEAATTLAQMAVRETAGTPVLSNLVRERQNRVRDWQAADKLLIAAKSEAPEKRNTEAEKALANRLAAIDTRLAEIDAVLAKDFSDYAALMSPKPISLVDVKASLRDDEALVLFLDTDNRFKPLPEETFIWVVTKSDSRWVRSDFGTKALQDRVAALRCGLDATSWVGEARARCAALLGLDSKKVRPRPLPFDLAKAHELYQELFGEVEDLITGKHLLIVPSGALTALPFQVLVTQAPKGNDLASAAWLIRDHALTVLPSVASLEALRRSHRLGQDRPVVADSRAPFIGFGNPMLAGSPACGKVFVPEKCPDEQLTVAVLPDTFARLGAVLTTVATYFRNGQADVAEVKKLCPLPDTAHELKCVARSLGAPASSIVVGKEMTETAVKSMPLDSYRVVHFATHGLLAGETAQLAKAHAEPALVFSPPDEATEQDDGLLTGSEVAGLQLDADWVVMSACNTAGGGKPGAEALSGLAKAFFYAGARALLVSHWPVNSYAATMLTSRTFAEIKAEPSIGRSEAFRRAMLALMEDRNRPWAAHPSVWAPFVVVGEGGAQAKH